MSSLVDLFQVKAMDYHWSNEAVVNHHAPLFTEPSDSSKDSKSCVASTVEYYLREGLDADKLMLGIPFYGRSFVLHNALETRLGALAEDEGKEGYATTTKGTLAYFEICTYINNYNWSVKHPYVAAMGPYAFKNHDWVAYDDPGIIKKKVQYMFEKDLGGITIWTLDMDDFKGECLGYKFPLIKTVQDAFLSYAAKINETKVLMENCLLYQHFKGNSNINAKYEDGKTQAMIAVEENDLNSLKCLVFRGANLNEKDKYGQNVVHIAAKRNRVTILKFLVTQEVDIDAEDYTDVTPLYKTAEEGYLRSVQVLLSSGADPSKGPTGTTAMHIAASFGYTSIVRELKNNCKCLKNLGPDWLGHTPLSYAVSGCHLDTVEELLEPSFKMLSHLLIAAVKNNCLEVFKFLLSSGGDINSNIDNQGMTPLMISISKNATDITKYCLDHGAIIDIQDYEGKTALHYAIISANVSIVKLLLDKNSNVNLKDGKYRTPLDYANKYLEDTGNETFKDIIQTLKEYGGKTEKFENLRNHFLVASSSINAFFKKP